jgi:Ras-related protein Rab-1A
MQKEGYVSCTFRFRTITVDGKKVKLQIWDTAGQERFRTITSAYYRGADGIIIVYDTTNRESFEHLDSWIAEVNKYASDKMVKVIVGNKSDKEGDRVVTTDEGMKKAESLGLSFIETSAKDSTHIEEAFALISRQLVRIREQAAAQADPNSSIRPSEGGLQFGGISSAAADKVKACCSG